MASCVACNKLPPNGSKELNKNFCNACFDCLEEPGFFYPIGSSLYSYKGVIRDLILRTKVGRDHTLLKVLVDLFLHHPSTKRELDLCECIMPVPSSFSGRIRGSIDITYFLARECAYHWNKKLMIAPIANHWRIFKRSKQKLRSARQLNFPVRRDSIPTLLIDDVITTGFSLLQLAYKLENSQCRFLTLGNAYSIREYQLE
ncbi:MAG: ComF family protein [Oligoflexales bacterium]